MNQIIGFPALKGPGVRKGAFLVLELNGNGCSLPNCNCSSPNFITIGDGTYTIKIELTHTQAALIKEQGRYEYEEMP